MDTNGTTIEIYLPQGEPRGLRIARITTRIVQAVLVPRLKLQEAMDRQELDRVGFYVLFGPDTGDRALGAYIGESESCMRRLGQHDSSERPWETAIALVAGTDGFTKAHSLYLQWLAIGRARDAGRYRLEQNEPAEPRIPEPLKAECRDHFATAETLVAALGYPIFDLNRPAERRAARFFLRIKGARGEGSPDDDGFIVRAGSICERDLRPSAPEGVARQRQALQDDGVLSAHTEGLAFVRDHAFRSPSGAAAVLVGGAMNGWEAWKDEQGRTLDEVVRGQEAAGCTDGGPR